MCDQWLVLDLLRSGSTTLGFYSLFLCINVKEPFRFNTEINWKIINLT
jgi:hypothetical protein